MTMVLLTVRTVAPAYPRAHLEHILEGPMYSHQNTEIRFIDEGHESHRVEGIVKAVLSDVDTEGIRLNLRLQVGDEVRWDHDIIESTIPVTYFLEQSSELGYILCTVNIPGWGIGSLSEIILFPDTPLSRRMICNHVGLHYPPTVGADPSMQPVLSVAIGSSGDVLDYRVNEKVLSNKEGGIQDLIVDNNQYLKLDFGLNEFDHSGPDSITAANRGYDATFYCSSGITVTGLHSIEGERSLVTLLFNDELKYDNELLLSCKPHTAGPGISAFLNGCLAVLCLDNHGNIVWTGLIAGVRRNSDGVEAYSHFTLDGKLLVLVAHDQKPAYWLNGTKYDLDVRNSSLMGFRRMAVAMIILSANGDLLASSHVGDGFFWVHNILALPDERLYMRAFFGSAFSFWGDNRGLKEGVTKSLVLHILDVPPGK